MTSDQWRKLRKLFAKARRLQPQARLAFIEDTCSDDLPLRRELESLLERHDQSSAFLGVLSSGGKQTLSHYRIEKRLGEGGMALVYKAWDIQLARYVALKVLPPWAAGNPESRERLLREARYAASFNHPNIVTIYEIARDNEIDFIVMECLSGKTLRDVIPTKGLSPERALHYVMQIAEALATAHEADIIHGDLKPSNIMITIEGHLKLLDFGLAVSLGAQDQPPSVFGTAEYMAPERNRGQPPAARSDVFSFGLVAFEMLTGRHPFQRDSKAVRIEAVPDRRLPRMPRTIPPGLVSAIHRCLVNNPDLRFQSAIELRDALAPLVWKKTSHSSAPSIGPASNASLQSAQVRECKNLLARINYESVADSLRAFDEVFILLQGEPPQHIRSVVASAMRALIVTSTKYKTAVEPAGIRRIRKRAIEMMKLATGNRLHTCLHTNDFEYLDLWNMDFAAEALLNFSFRKAFLIESTFESCNLANTCFREASIRNVNFTASRIEMTDFTDADWFNAVGLTEAQIITARPETLMACPPNVVALHDYLATHYYLPFRAWTEEVRDELLAAWEKYLQPGGLRDVVNEIRKQIQTKEK